jgi:predicted O-methyltransferase YrrM
MDATRQTFLDELYAHGRDVPEALRNVEPEAAELLGVLVRALSARRVLEVGTSNGYSTIWLGDAPDAIGGKDLILENDAERHALGQKNLIEAEVDRCVEVRTQDAAEALAGFEDGSFDLIFLDAERREYASYWPDIVRVLRDRGMLVVANTLSHAKDLVEFSELVYAAEDMTSTLLTVGAGVLLVVKSP